MSSPAKDIAGLLENLGHGTQGVDIFVNFMPESPNNCILVQDRDGEGDIQAITAIDNLKISITSRNVSQETAYNNILSIRNDLHSRSSYTVNNDRYFGFYLQTQISSLGIDEKFNHVFICFFRLLLRPNNKGNRI